MRQSTGNSRSDTRVDKLPKKKQRGRPGTGIGTGSVSRAMNYDYLVLCLKNCCKCRICRILVSPSLLSLSLTLLQLVVNWFGNRCAVTRCSHALHLTLDGAALSSFPMKNARIICILYRTFFVKFPFWLPRLIWQNQSINHLQLFIRLALINVSICYIPHVQRSINTWWL